MAKPVTITAQKVVNSNITGKGRKVMKIKSVKANYSIQAAPKLRIKFEINNDEEGCHYGRWGFEPDSSSYGLLGTITIYDETEDLFQAWEEKVNLRSKLYYGFLDELVENAVFHRMKAISSNPDEMIGSYRVDDPAVVWLGRKEIFKKVVRGWAIHDRKTFSGEILGENEKAENVKVVLSDNGLVQLYIDNKMIKEGYIDPRRYVSEKMDDNGEVVKQFERIEFMELLDEIETHI